MHVNREKISFETNTKEYVFSMDTHILKYLRFTGKGSSWIALMFKRVGAGHLADNIYQNKNITTCIGLIEILFKIKRYLEMF